ncbi:MAG TPA: hypothetical protein VK541_06380 [Pedobacter sp.]|uniref:hypothetical protein n=1 Tax=Pedobacter sp. TaxID=1411316 RepID=UPI002B5E8B63|nr:hypothetical protein [Pedobacter sp.]HMI02090.1 hypothetical protein [Pedobacter sp.]
MKSTLRLLLAGHFLFFMACKKISSKKREETAPPTEQPVKRLVPLKFESDQLQITLKYQENTANLIEIAGSDGYTMTITYKNQQPYEIKKMKNNKPFQLIDYVKDREGLPKARSFDENGAVFTPTGYYILDYDQNQLLVKIRFYKDNGELFRESTLSYSLGNVTTQIQSNYPGGSKNLHYTYDLKNGIFKHLKYPERLLLETRYPFFSAGQNNILSSTGTETLQEKITYNHEYNEDGYPSQIMITDHNMKQNFKVTYMELKQ